MASQPATENVLSYDLETVGQDHYLQKSCNSDISDQFLPNFHKNAGNVAENKNVISADFETVGQGHSLQKSLFLG